MNTDDDQPADRRLHPFGWRPDRERTESLCPVCLERIPARRTAVGDNIHLVKTCSRHGTFETPIWRGSPIFERWRRDKIPIAAPAPLKATDSDCPYDCGPCPVHRQRPCTVIIEVTQRCNLSCPVCYADAPSDLPDPSAALVAQLFHRAAETAPGSNIQLSGGEPTVRNDLPELVAMGREVGFDFIQVNTNGLRFAKDPGFVKALKQAGLASVFLQFDGIDDHVYRRLRGRALMADKRAAIAACAQEGIGVVLVPTLVPGVNTRCIGEILEAALSWTPAVRGVHFQPVSYFGRFGEKSGGMDRFTLPEVIRAIESQSNGMVKAEDLGPPGCENALCSFHGRFLYSTDGEMVPLKASAPVPCCSTPATAEAGAARAMAAVARQWKGPQQPIAEEGCGDGRSCRPPVGAPAQGDAVAPMSLDVFIDRARTHTFSISAMAFQDAWTITLDRVQECCIIVMAPDGRQVPFCLYNLTAEDGRRLYRP
ncbi:MAG: radical SAM protein [Desulfobacteraceae bacterium]